MARAAEPAPLKFQDGIPVIMYAGRLEYIKGVHVLIEALGMLHKRCQRWICAVAGMGSLLEELLEQTRRLGISEQVYFTGKLDNIPAALKAADIYVQPSLQDTQPFSVTEAQLAGIAPVVAGTSGMPEMVRQGETGWVVPPGDAAALARQLEQLLGDGELRQRTGRQARAWAVNNRSLDDMASGTLKVYQKAIEQQAGQQGIPDPVRFAGMPGGTGGRFLLPSIRPMCWPGAGALFRWQSLCAADCRSITPSRMRAPLSSRRNRLLPAGRSGKVVMPSCLKHIHESSNILGLCSGLVSGIDYAKKEDISRV